MDIWYGESLLTCMTEPPLPRLWIRSPHVPEVLFLALAPPCLEIHPQLWEPRG